MPGFSLARKIPAGNTPFGTTAGYALQDDPPAGISRAVFLDTLRRSAATLDIQRGICMLDFIVRGSEMVLLEIAPRYKPGKIWEL